MSELDALAQKLATLTARDSIDPSGARLISVGGDPAPLTAMLREVDDTVLERSLVFECAGTTVTIVAAGRRLRGIVSVTPENNADIIGQVISREEPDGVQAALDLLQNLCGKADRMTVRSLPPQAFGKGGERGISAKGLSELWGVTMDTTPKPPMEQFLSQNAESFSSVLHVRKGEVIQTAGDFAALQAIWKDQVDAFRKAHAKTLRGEEGAQLVCLEGAFDDGSSAAVALYENEVALVAYKAECFGHMQSSWQRIFT
ncbi:hypothetical protein [Roseobacter sp. CCS2]|uniref:hypothetical protein n=1 Tax=Roseobacter sp. CCS2 TaxID=391593 RepID=UPI0000F400D9|nr:hypothetical protein [Roseobacter sp. CCS2]EBA13759.1 hypothetical protein RCCS2_07719 [Roseobacter sp. CCS2]